MLTFASTLAGEAAAAVRSLLRPVPTSGAAVLLLVLLAPIAIVWSVAGASNGEAAAPPVGERPVPTAPSQPDTTTTAAATPPPAEPESGSHAFTTMVGGEPVGFDPCESLTVVYDPEGEPYDATADLREATELLADGLDRPVGFETGTDPTDGAVIDVGWVPTWDQLPGAPTATTVGVGGFRSSGPDAIDGAVTLAASGELAPGSGPGSWMAAYLHELGHAVGLGHTPDDPGEQMYPTIRSDRPVGWGPGDLIGLDQLGGPCTDP